MSPAHIDENWPGLEEGTALAARIAGLAVIVGRMHTAKGMSHRLSGEFAPASATFAKPCRFWLAAWCGDRADPFS